jgi:hypothetical protein
MTARKNEKLKNTRIQLAELVKKDPALKGTVFETLLTTLATFSVDEFNKCDLKEVAPEEVVLGTVNEFEMALMIMMNQLMEKQQSIFQDSFGMIYMDNTDAMLEAVSLKNQHSALCEIVVSNIKRRFPEWSNGDYSGLGIRKNGTIVGLPDLDLSDLSEMFDDVIWGVGTDGCCECDACRARKAEQE